MNRGEPLENTHTNVKNSTVKWKKKQKHRIEKKRQERKKERRKIVFRSPAKWFGTHRRNKYQEQRRCRHQREPKHCRIVRAHQLHEQENPWIVYSEINKTKKTKTTTISVLHYLISVYSHTQTQTHWHADTQVRITTTRSLDGIYGHNTICNISVLCIVYNAPVYIH